MTKMLSCCPIKSLAFLTSSGKTKLSVLSLKLGRLLPIIMFEVLISTGRFSFYLLL